MNIHHEAMAARSLLRVLSDIQNDQHDELEEDDIRILLEGQTNLLEAIQAALLANAEDAAHVQAIAAIAANLQARADRKVHRIERRRAAILTAMEMVGLPKVELAAATVSVGKGSRKVIITDQELIPAEFMREKVTRSPDKDAIGKAIAAKKQVPGAELSNTMPTLTVRTK